MWKCHNETLYVDILNKQKCPFFKNGEQESTMGLEVCTSGRSEEGEYDGNIMY
jgi:hypothetical protein